MVRSYDFKEFLSRINGFPVFEVQPAVLRWGNTGVFFKCCGKVPCVTKPQIICYLGDA